MLPMTRRAVALSAGCLMWLACAGGVQTQSQTEIATLRKDIESLKAGQAALEKQLQEIKNLMRSGQNNAVADAPPNAIIQISGAPTRGETTARVVMIEFSDYQCPFCARYTRDVWPSIDKNYVQAGRLRYVFRGFPIESIHKQAFKAHEAAACAGAQGKYWLMHDELFTHQTALEPTDLKRYAKTIGLDPPVFDLCLDSGKMTSVVRQDADLGAQIGVSGTPLFLIGTARPDGAVSVLKVITGAQSYDTIKRVLDEVLTAK
jgi:protein-disulfide isomerase